MAWNDPSGRPNCLRPFACSTAISRIRWAQPTISAARARAPAWSAGRSASHPRPAAPRRSSGLSSTAAKLTSQGRSPAMASIGRTEMPGARASSKKRFKPEAPRVATISSSATCASFTKSLRPESLPPGSPASVMDSPSIDALSSVSERTPMRSPRASAGRCRSRCAALPLLATSVVATTALCTYGLGKHARPISSRRSATSSMPPPLPPYSGETRRPGQPRTEISFQSSAEKPRSLATLSAMALAGHWRRRNSRAVFMRSCWAGVTWRSRPSSPSPSQPSPPRSRRAPRLEGRSSPSSGARGSCSCLGGQAEAARGYGGAEDLRGAAGDGLAEARLVEVLDGAVEPGPARLGGERRVETEQLHAEGGHRLPCLVGHHLHERRLVGRGQPLADHPRDPVEEQAHRLHVGDEGGQAPPHAGIAREGSAASLSHVRILDQLAEHASEHG